MEQSPAPSARTKLLDAAQHLLREQGYEATSVDDLCRAAGVTKGAFFHHFRSKEELGTAAAAYWTQWTEAAFAQAPYHQYEDPLDQLIAYVDFRIALLQGRSLREFTCLLGTMVQETYSSHPALQQACWDSLSVHMQSVMRIVAAAKARHAPHATWTAESVALHMQAVIQGSFILAKAKGKADVAAECMRHLRRYLELLFHFAREE